jgi:hypothetical protein
VNSLTLLVRHPVRRVSVTCCRSGHPPCYVGGMRLSLICLTDDPVLGNVGNYPLLQCNIPEDMNLHSHVVVSRLVHADQSDIKHCNFKRKNIVSQYLGMKYHTDVQMLTPC